MEMYKPRDEMSLRHFFMKYAESILKIEYLGPVIDERNRVQNSPDCYVVDKRGGKPIVKRCEFKADFIGSNGFVKAFAPNGKFDIAIVWKITGNKERNRREMIIQNECKEIIELCTIEEFKNAKEYSYANIQSLLLEKSENNSEYDSTKSSIPNEAERILRKYIKDKINQRGKTGSKEDLIAKLNIKAAYIYALMGSYKICKKELRNYLQKPFSKPKEDNKEEQMKSTNENNGSPIIEDKGNAITSVEQRLQKIKILTIPFDEYGEEDTRYLCWNNDKLDCNTGAEMIKAFFQRNWSDEQLPEKEELEKLTSIFTI